MFEEKQAKAAKIAENGGGGGGDGEGGGRKKRSKSKKNEVRLRASADVEMHSKHPIFFYFALVAKNRPLRCLATMLSRVFGNDPPGPLATYANIHPSWT